MARKGLAPDVLAVWRGRPGGLERAWASFAGHRRGERRLASTNGRHRLALSSHHGERQALARPQSFTCMGLGLADTGRRMDLGLVGQRAGQGNARVEPIWTAATRRIQRCLAAALIDGNAFSAQRPGWRDTSFSIAANNARHAQVGVGDPSNQAAHQPRPPTPAQSRRDNLLGIGKGQFKVRVQAADKVLVEEDDVGF
jgi:hypothetical protein